MESYNNGLEQRKKEKWEAIVQEVESNVDSLGKHIDEDIKESVISIKAHGFGTLASCEGHLDRGFPYPWIDIGSQLAEEDSNNKSRYSELWKAHVREIQANDKMTNAEKGELQEMINLQISANKEALSRFEELLNEFNELSNIDDVKLELRGSARNRARLQPANVPSGSFKVVMEELAKLSDEEIANNLNAYRREMDRFAEFLKKKFFKF